jgi:hypothetical protein
MIPWGRLAKWVAAAQAGLWAALLVVFVWVLPRQGFEGLADFNDPAKLAGAREAMMFIVWSDLAFGVTTLIIVFVLYQYQRTRMPRLAAAVMVVLAGAVLWFIGHDVGFHLLAWPAIEGDPAGTNYAMDRVLWAYRNGMFLAVSVLTALATSPAKRTHSSQPPRQVAGFR